MKATEQVMQRAVELAAEAMTGLGSPGICLECGNEQEGCEPDARNYKCEACGKPSVFGAEEILLMGY
jgi:hypothetical protein